MSLWGHFILKWGQSPEGRWYFWRDYVNSRWELFLGGLAGEGISAAKHTQTGLGVTSKVSVTDPGLGLFPSEVQKLWKCKLFLTSRF